MYRDPFEPQVKTSVNMFFASDCTSPSLVTVLFICFVSDCTSFFLGEECNMSQFLYQTAHWAQPNTLMFVSLTRTGKPQPQHGFGVSSWAQKILKTTWKMST